MKVQLMNLLTVSYFCKQFCKEYFIFCNHICLLQVLSLPSPQRDCVLQESQSAIDSQGNDPSLPQTEDQSCDQWWSGSGGRSVHISVAQQRCCSQALQHTPTHEHTNQHTPGISRVVQIFYNIQFCVKHDVLLQRLYSLFSKIKFLNDVQKCDACAESLAE